ncbi:DUF2780 domain-containing protein [Photobacterium sp. TY1-4]|uniref:DUF2780 domain-containing protein n=1 Tax=Photobacterium sp. TY1-4 TaxID=2899122 RepID=UPI0021BF395B|nr:DUF2780 domain-containing protein [Photobacterium sp. TY1-4]UXI01050.1 DUF2780 domain-containing protein [Photobacterium sp. TY1-4]
MVNTLSMLRHLFVPVTLIAALLLSTTSAAFSLSDLFGSGDDKSAAANNPLTELLTSQLDVSPEQAAGGAGALLSLASSQLSGDQASELSKMIPGADQLSAAIPAELSGMLGNMETINKIFTTLGMDPSMVSQFIPVILKFVGSKGASAGLMDALGSVWNPVG